MPGQPFDESVVNGPSARPYVDYKRTTRQRWAYTDWRCSPGYLPWVEPDPRGTGRVIIEPHIKQGASPNKQWGWNNWQALVDSSSMRFTQIGPPGTRLLRGVDYIQTRSFDEAVNVLATARAAVLPEGGLHHACAAVDTPAVVLFGAMTSPANTGYDEQVNIWIDDPEALGWRIPHHGCKRAWLQIQPELVMTALERVLQMRS